MERRPDFDVGGQAVMDGVMMRAGDAACVAVRRADGIIVQRMLPCPGWAARWRHVPGVRGLAALAESLHVGVQALAWSEEQTVVRHDGKRPAPIWVVMAIAVVAVVAMVVVIPAVVAGLFPSGSFGFAAAETAARLGVAGGYVAAVSRRPEVRRVFEYHGAEHLVVAAHEVGGSMAHVDVLRGSIRHPRCGTSFLLVIAAVAAAVHPLLPVDPWSSRIGARLLVVPVVAAVAYEAMRWLGRRAAARPGGLAERVLLSPQRFTTRRPDVAHIEVAIVALEGALARRTPADPRRHRRMPGHPDATGPDVGVERRGQPAGAGERGRTSA